MSRGACRGRFPARTHGNSNRVSPRREATSIL